MTLVAVIYLRIDAEFPQGADTTDTKHKFLLQAVLPVATVKVIGDLAVLREIGLVVSVEEIEVGASDRHFPNSRGNVPSRESHAGGHPIAVFVKHRLSGNLREILGVVLGHLLSLAGQNLGEITVPVKEAYGDEIDVHVAGLLKVISSEDSETSGIDLKGSVQTIFHAEITDGRIGTLGLQGHVLTKLIHHGLVALQEGVILSQLVEPLDTHDVKKGHRVVPGVMPDFGVDGLEQSLGALVPAPPEVL